MSEITFDKYKLMLSKLANKFQADGMEYDDLFQEFSLVYLNCEKHFDESKGKFSTYLWASCSNKASELRRKNYSHNTLSLDYEVGNDTLGNYIADDFDLEDTALLDFKVDDILEVLKRSPNGDYSLLYIFGNMTQEEIAELKGVSRSYVQKVHSENVAELTRILSIVNFVLGN
jgi:RNA polymerase sigma factor (sigma-70 family)